MRGFPKTDLSDTTVERNVSAAGRLFSEADARRFIIFAAASARSGREGGSGLHFGLEMDGPYRTAEGVDLAVQCFARRVAGNRRE